MATEIVNTTRNLPTTVTGEVERAGYAILRGLDRLGFTHVNQDGATFSIRFDTVKLYGECWAAYHVDAERMWHVSVADLAKPSVLAQLAAVTRKPVRTFDDGGLAFVVELQAKPKVRLPDHVALDLGARPAGDLLVPLGLGRTGPVWVGLPKLGHALIAGTTGSGKSTLLHSTLAALLTGAGPDRLRVALVDPKRSEFTAWAGVPHLLGRIAHTTDQAADLLGDLVTEVDRRGDLLASALVRDIGAYNRKAAEPLPYILAMVDECLDLVLDAGNKSELAGYLKSLAIRGRSAGVFLWAATQHGAAVTGMPRVVNTNLATRLVFRVADDSAARSAGCPGAETLPRDKPGRLLVKIDHDPQELQGYTLSDDDLLAVARGLAGEDATKPKRLPDSEATLVHYAVNTLGGFFVVNRLAAAFATEGVTSHKVKTLAQQWERRGLLTTPKHATDARRVTQALCELAGLTAQANA
jgi:energy-coupling factor transporter ATP-binding protein EcfA2